MSAVKEAAVRLSSYFARELVEVHAERGEVAALHEGPRRVGVVLLERVAEALPLGDQDAALVAPQLPAREAQEQRDQGQVEQQVAGLLEVALLGGELPLPADDPEPADPQLLLDDVERLRPGQRRRQVPGVGEAQQVPRRRRRGRPHRAEVLQRARQHAADQRDEQQQVHRGEPRRAEDVEQVQPVQHRGERRVVGEVRGDLVLRQRPLRQQRARHRGEGEQEQQHDRRAHGGQPPPPAQQEPAAAGSRRTRRGRPAIETVTAPPRWRSSVPFRSLCHV